MTGFTGFGFVDPRPRTFSVMYGPTPADPTCEFTFVEFSPKRVPEGTPVHFKPWTGWRADLIVWLIRHLLPEPSYIYGRD